jgi:hypothetical protein
MDVNPDAIRIAQETVDELAQQQSNALMDALY